MNRLLDSQMVRDASDGLYAQCGGRPQGDGFRNFAACGFLDLARDFLARGGVNPNPLSRDELLKRALSTSDYSTVLNAVGEKLVRDSYGAFPLAHHVFARKATASSFKPVNRPGVSSGKYLDEVPEGGQIQSRAATAEMGSYSLHTYAGIIPLTRRLLINDDIGAFASISRDRGRAAAETERKVVWDFIKGNPTAPDGVALFSASHASGANTTTATAGNAVSTTTLAAARKALREQTDPEGTKINSTVRYIVCGTALETSWEQLVNGLYVPTSASSAMTPSLRSVQVLVEPEVEGEDWFAFADPRMCEHIEYAYLDGSEGPRVEQRPGFDIEGIELKVALDFGVGVIDHRGAYWLDGA